jgi:electron transport complex protein RnfB
MAVGEAPINQCPPGGAEGVRRLAALTGQSVVPLNPDHGLEGPRGVAWIDEDWCIGCTLCIQACPVDCIIGSNKRMHTVIESQCTGCELCVAACPVDCIHMEPVSGERTGWAAWSPQQADAARARHAATQARRQSAPEPADSALPPATGSAPPDSGPEPAEAQRKRSVIEAALARARARQPTA